MPNVLPSSYLLARPDFIFHPHTDTHTRKRKIEHRVFCFPIPCKSSPSDQNIHLYRRVLEQEKSDGLLHYTKGNFCPSVREEGDGRTGWG